MPGRSSSRFFPTDLSGGKPRPVLMLRQASCFNDWLVCMVSSQVQQTEAELDEILTPADVDFDNYCDADPESPRQSGAVHAKLAERANA